jgi:hypothetical protein
LQDFIQALKQSFESRNLDYQKQKYGSLLKITLPIFKNRIDPLFLPYVGQADLNSFYSSLGSTLHLQDNHIVAITQVSGAGKTRLCFEVGSDASTNYFSIFIRFCENDTPTLPLTWMISTIDGLDKKMPQKRRAEKSLHLFRLFVFAHIEWAMLIANEFEDLKKSREACLRALNDIEGQKGVVKILADRWQDFSKLPATDKSPIISQNIMTSASSHWLAISLCYYSWTQ